MNIIKLLVTIMPLLSDAKVKKTPQRGYKDCPTVRAISNFVLQEFKGKWYEVFTSEQPTSANERCDQYTFSLTKYGSMNIYRKFMRGSGVEVKMMGVGAELEESTLSTFYPAYPAESKSFDILDTDYKNYALLYLCDTDYNVWILSRNTTIDRQHLAMALKNLALQGLTNFYLYPTDQHHCSFSSFK